MKKDKFNIFEINNKHIISKFFNLRGKYIIVGSELIAFIEISKMVSTLKWSFLYMIWKYLNYQTDLGHFYILHILKIHLRFNVKVKKI